MIRINLLPDEYRQPEGLSWRLRVAFGVCALVLVTAGSGAFVAAGWLQRARADQARLDGQIRELQPEADRCRAIEEEVQRARARQQAILAIRESKTFWSKKLHQLVDLTPPDVWYERIEMHEGAGTAQDPGTLTISCMSKGADLARVSRFREALQQYRPFWSVFDDMAPPRSKIRELGEEFVEADRKNLSFDVVFRLRPREREAEEGP